MSEPAADEWVLPSPLPGEADMPWLFRANRVVGLRWKGGILLPDNPRFRLGAFPCAPDGSPFPIQFTHDPATGEELRPAPSDAPLSSHPGHGRDGFPALLTGIALRRRPERERTRMPDGTVAVFAAGAPVRIFALTNRGNLFYRNAPGEWTELGTFAPVSMPLHCFGVCAFRQGFATVVGDRALIVRLIPGLPEPCILRSDYPRWRFCGPPAMLEDDILAFPVRQGPHVRIARYAIAKGDWIEEPLPAGSTRMAEGTFYGPPVQNTSTSPDTYWVGERECLRTRSNFGQRKADILPAPDDFTYVRGAPVLRDERDTLHALARGADAYAFLSLTDRPARTPLDGPALAAGRGYYFARAYHPSISRPESIELKIEAGGDNVLVPLAYAVDSRGEQDGALLILAQHVPSFDALFQPDGDTPISGPLYWHEGNQLHPLEITLTFRSRQDLIVFRDNDALNLGSALNNVFYRIALP